jgi:hypothetical protein
MVPAAGQHRGASVTAFRKFVAIALVECFLPVSLPQHAQAAAASERGERLHQKVEHLGAGAEVRAMLRDQRIEPRGTIESVDDSAFRLQPGGNGERRAVGCTDVTLLEFTQGKYRAEGSADPVTARHVGNLVRRGGGGLRRRGGATSMR